ncbi:MAG: T9SS type A sorting domain-containing protein [Calditrichaeota bacterium]|nr:T9SS type A sorting domain-containing protein [Calditrichota bacterium]
MSARIAFLSLCLLIFAVAFFNITYAANITLDADVEFQTMEGWGASSNFFEERIGRLPAENRETAFDFVYDDLGTNILCIRLYSDFQIEEGGDYNWGCMAVQRMIVNEALERGKINTIWLKVSSPPGWMKDNNDARHAGNVLEEHYQNYADYLTYYVSHMRDDYGITIDAVSIFNEPGWPHNNVNYESTSTSPEAYRDVLKFVGQTFEENDLDDVMLIGPESGHITGDRGCLNTYLPVIFADSIATSYLDKITTHQYGDQLVVYGTGPADNWAGLRDLAAENSLPIWETEMFIGGNNQATEDIVEGLKVALLMWTAVTQGNVTAWHYWQYINPDESEDNKSQGVVAIAPRVNEIEVFPRYYCMKQWTRNVPQGSIRIDAVSDDENLHVAGFKVEDDIVIVAFNRTEEVIAANFEMELISGEIEHIRTSARENYISQDALQYNNQGFEVELPSNSICTFIVPTGHTAIEQDGSVPEDFNILRCYPNPFNSRMQIEFELPYASKVGLNILNISGERLKSLTNREYSAGIHKLEFDATGYPAGIYFVSLNSYKRTAKKICLIK